MKIAVFSDTHRRIEGAVSAIRKYQPDLIIHLGDHYGDAADIQNTFPDIPMERVPGNCDYAPGVEPVRYIEPMGVRMMLCHGHTYNVKMELLPLMNAACFSGSQIVMFGHTHEPLYRIVRGIHVLNPGTAGKGRHLTWATIELEDGEIKDIRLRDI